MRAQRPAQPTTSRSTHEARRTPPPTGQRDEVVPEARAPAPSPSLRRAPGRRRALLPAIDEFDREDLVWTDLSTRPRVHVVRSGLLLSKVYTSDDQEFPYALFSEGFVSGLTELYTPFGRLEFLLPAGHHPRPDMPLRQRRRQGDRRRAARLPVAGPRQHHAHELLHRQLRPDPHSGPRHRPGTRWPRSSCAS